MTDKMIPEAEALAMVAAAYEAASKTCDVEWQDDIGDVLRNRMEAILALTPADAKAALDRLIAEALAAERERCAKVAVRDADQQTVDAAFWRKDLMPKTAVLSEEQAKAGRRIAAAIREGRA